MDELQKENLLLKQQINGLQYSSSSLASELNLSQNDATQMELQLAEKEELVSRNLTKLYMHVMMSSQLY